MLGWNLGWGGYQQPVRAGYSYSPWSSWTNSFSPSNPSTPFGGHQGGLDISPLPPGSLDVYESGQVAGTQQGGDIFQQADYMRRLQIMQALGPEAARRIPNWRTMPFNDFLLAAAQLRGGGNVRPNPQPGQRLPVNVVAKSYWENGQRVPVKKVNIWDLGNVSQNTYNSVQQNDFYSTLDKGIQGKRYRITVEWENGRSYVWDHTNDGSNITIWQPNQ